MERDHVPSDVAHHGFAVVAGDLLARGTDHCFVGSRVGSDTAEVRFRPPAHRSSWPMSGSARELLAFALVDSLHGFVGQPI